MKNKKTIVAVAGICLLGIIAGTLAYFSTTDLFHNLFDTDFYQMDTYEVFDAPENWRPGDTTPKTFSVTNTGNVDAAVRVSFIEEWIGKDGYNKYSNNVGIINFVDNYGENWKRNTINGEYYYYINKLKPGETTEPLIQSITFNPDFSDDTIESCDYDSTTHKKTCTVLSTHSDATYRLTIKIETVQFDHYQKAWNTTIKLYDSHPYNFKNHIESMVGSSQVANDDPDGNVRYIGTNPNNYVSFNNELWRIIGTNQNSTRIIRNDALGRFCMDSTESDINNGKGVNDFSQSKLKVELNSDYTNDYLYQDTNWYTSLRLEKGSFGVFNHNYVIKNYYYNMMRYQTIYLGSPNNDNGTEVYISNPNFNASYVYNKERSNSIGKTCTSDTSDCTDTYTRNTSSGVYVSLINLSDFLYSTSGGSTTSREDCLTNNIDYFNHHNECGTNSWINNLEPDSLQFTITPSASGAGGHYMFGYGFDATVTSSYGTQNSNPIHPVVELKNNVVYLSGDGSQSNPYIVEQGY